MQPGLRVMLDGVFNHVGRGFWAFRDVQEKKWDSPYRDWFHLSFDGRHRLPRRLLVRSLGGPLRAGEAESAKSGCGRTISSTAIRRWVEELDIDGLRLDVAYCLPRLDLRAAPRLYRAV